MANITVQLHVLLNKAEQLFPSRKMKTPRPSVQFDPPLGIVFPRGGRVEGTLTHIAPGGAQKELRITQSAQRSSGEGGIWVKVQQRRQEVECRLIRPGPGKQRGSQTEEQETKHKVSLGGKKIKMKRGQTVAFY